jgi:hypothetical protein
MQTISVLEKLRDKATNETRAVLEEAIDVLCEQPIDEIDEDNPDHPDVLLKQIQEYLLLRRKNEHALFPQQVGVIKENSFTFPNVSSLPEINPLPNVKVDWPVGERFYYVDNTSSSSNGITWGNNSITYVNKVESLNI